MMTKESESKFLKEATDILSSSLGNPHSLEEREKLAIDLSANILKEANRTITRAEKKLQAELFRMMRDPIGKVFTTSMTDECFRSHRSGRVADQLVFLLKQFGIPKYLGWQKKFSLKLFKMIGEKLSFILVPIATSTLRKATAKVILPGEKRALKKHMEKRRSEGVRLNLNHLGEAILGEEEAKRRLNVYLKDLEQADIEYISVKISTIYSQIHFWAGTTHLKSLAERLRELYRASNAHTFQDQMGRCLNSSI